MLLLHLETKEYRCDFRNLEAIKLKPIIEKEEIKKTTTNYMIKLIYSMNLVGPPVKKC